MRLDKLIYMHAVVKLNVQMIEDTEKNMKIVMARHELLVFNHAWRSIV